MRRMCYLLILQAGQHKMKPRGTRRSASKESEDSTARTHPDIFSPEIFLRGVSGNYSFTRRSTIGKIYTNRANSESSSDEINHKPANTGPWEKLHGKVRKVCEGVYRRA